MNVLGTNAKRYYDKLKLESDFYARRAMACDHKYVSYVGVQYNITDKENYIYYLVNCTNCRTTRVFNPETMEVVEGLERAVSEFNERQRLKKWIKKLKKS